MSKVSWVPKIGSDFAGYRLEELIGHGGMSIVYRAQHLQLERTVALKLLMPELSDDESFRERFVRESRLAASLDHPNIIPIYEAGDEDGVFYIAMRFVAGATLKALLQSEGPLDTMRTVSIVSQVSSALQAAHEEKGLIHRDVKPANILVVPEHGAEGTDHVYLSDFGIAKQHAVGGGLTKTGMFVGTADYAAPEQIEGKELDRRADIYALGCVLYECLTGAPTYEKDSEVALMYAHLLESPPKVTDARPDLPPEIDAVVAKAMAKSRDDRYATAREFAAAARKALTGTESTGTVQAPLVETPETVQAAPPVPAAQTTSPPAPAQPAAAEAGPPPPAAGPPPPGGRRRRLSPAIIGIAVAVLVVVAGGIVAAVVLAGGGGGGGDGGSAKPADTLLAVLVPTEVANACTTQTVPKSGAVETDICSPPPNASAAFPDSLELSFYSGGAAALQAYAAAESESGVPTNTGRCDRTHWKGEGVWSHATTGKFGGHRVCYFDSSGAAVIAWTHEKRGSADHADMFAIASEPGRGSQTGLFSWWHPYHEVIGKCRAKVSEELCFSTIEKITGTS